MGERHDESGAFIALSKSLGRKNISHGICIAVEINSTHSLHFDCYIFFDILVNLGLIECHTGEKTNPAKLKFLFSKQKKIWSASVRTKEFSPQVRIFHVNKIHS